MNKLTLFLLAFLASMVIFSVPAFAAAVGGAGLSTGGYLGLTVALVLGSSLLTWLGGKVGPFGQTVGTLLKSLQANFVSYDKVDAAAKNILDSVGVPAPFSSWIADIAAKILTSIPGPSIGADTTTKGSRQISLQQRDALAGAYSRLPVKQAYSLLNGAVPAEIMSEKFARKRIASALLGRMYNVMTPPPNNRSLTR